LAGKNVSEMTYFYCVMHQIYLTASPSYNARVYDCINLIIMSVKKKLLTKDCSSYACTVFYLTKCTECLAHY